MCCAGTGKQAIQTNYVKHKIDKTAESPLCRMYDKKSETISHIVKEREKLSRNKYDTRARQCCKNKSLEAVWKVQPEKK